eukprot:8631550-Pyramimonas_sp.AAC.1
MGRESGLLRGVCYNPCAARSTERLNDIVQALPLRDIYALVRTQAKSHGEQVNETRPIGSTW